MNWLKKIWSSRSAKTGNFFYQEIERITGLKPKNERLYQQALSHSSAIKNKEKRKTLSYQRLEFLGDAVLGMIIAEKVFFQYQEHDEGFLTNMRAKIVSRKNLNKIGTAIGLKPLIQEKLNDPKSAKSITGDALEALIGAIYLDHGMENATRFIIDKIIEPHLDFKTLENAVVSYKSRIIEWSQQSKKSYRFEQISSWGKKHKMTFLMGFYLNQKLIAKGEGASKKQAEENAAKEAFQILLKD